MRICLNFPKVKFDQLALKKKKKSIEENNLYINPFTFLKEKQILRCKHILDDF